MVNTRIILQARVGSSRYPGKMIADIRGRTLLERVLDRLEAAMHGTPQILAIPDDSPNDVMSRIAEHRGWDVFRGSESDVLGRYAGAIRQFKVDRFVRATGDNPLFDIEGLRLVISALDDHDFSYGVGYPKGGIFAAARAEALLAADAETRDPYDREHVFPFLHKYPKRFRFREIACPWKNAQRFRLTVDTAEDIENVRSIFQALGDAPSFADVISLLESSGERYLQKE